MSLYTKSLGAAALLAGALVAGHSYANEAAVNAAMNACTADQSPSSRLPCEFGVLSMNKVMTAAKAGESGTIRYDFRTENEPQEHKLARDRMYSELRGCDASGKKRSAHLDMSNCHIKAFENYQTEIEK